MHANASICVRMCARMRRCGHMRVPLALAALLAAGGTVAGGWVPPASNVCQRMRLQRMRLNRTSRSPGLLAEARSTE